VEKTSEENGRRPAVRLLLRCCVLIAAVVLALGILPWPWAAMILPAASPYLMVCSAIALRSLGVAALVGLPILAIALLLRRWFCRNACPVGLILEYSGRIRAPAESKLAAVPPLGQWIVLVTLGGACLGYPLLLWLDPLAILAGFLGLWWRTPLCAVALVPALGLPLLVTLNLLWPRLWCLRICPLGATQELLAAPIRTLRRAGASPAQTADRRRAALPRRAVLAAGLGAVWATLTLRASASGQPKSIRPPGSVDPGQFAGLCVRCGNCVRACPEGIIHPDLADQGIAGFLTPVVRFEGAYCREDCRRCSEVCPSGAIRRFSLEEKGGVSIGLASVDMSRCLLSAENGEKECSVCKNACPYEAIRMGWDEESYTAFPKIDPEKCPGCGACQVACPTSPEKAIVVEPC